MVAVSESSPAWGWFPEWASFPEWEWFPESASLPELASVWAPQDIRGLDPPVRS